MNPTWGWALIGAAWLLGSFGGGALLAWLGHRLYPAASFHKLWALWAIVLQLGAGALLALRLI